MNEEKDLQKLLAKKVEAEFDAWVGDISRNSVDQAGQLPTTKVVGLQRKL